MSLHFQSSLATTPAAAAPGLHADHRLAVLLRRYEDILANSCPAFTDAEWSALADALADTDLEDADSLRRLYATVCHELQRRGLERKWGIDARALSRRLGALSRAEEAALVEIVEFRLGRGRGA